MAKRMSKNVKLLDKSLSARKAKNVKGGYLYIDGYAALNYSKNAGLTIPGPHVITAAGPGAGPH